MKITPIFITCLLFYAYTGCQSKSGTSKAQGKSKNDSLPPTGQVVSDVFCGQTSGSESYALYLPTAYNTYHDLPVVIFFDPQGSGSFPLKSYSQLAEKFGYILIGSNNSRNGLTEEQYNGIYLQLRSEAISKLGADKNRIYLAGFSGGSRVVSQLMMQYDGIEGVVGCGAGKNPLQQKPVKCADIFIGIAGNQDFNLFDVQGWTSWHVENNRSAYMLVFDGKHAWPPAETFELAMTAWELHYLTKQKRLHPLLSVEELKKVFDNYLKKSDVQQDVEQKYLVLQMADKLLKNITEKNQYSFELSNLSNSMLFRQAMEKKKQIANRQFQLQHQYAQFLLEKDTTWWKSEIARIENQSVHHPDAEERLMNKRIMGFLGVAAYSYSNREWQSGDFNRILNMLTRYAIVDKTNPEPHIMLAILLAKDYVNKAIKELDKAADLGFADIQRVQNEKALENIRNRAEYSAILKKIRKNSEND